MARTCKLGDVSHGWLSWRFDLKDCTTLNLRSNSMFGKIGAEGARALAEALKANSAITSLNLYGNSIGAEGARALAEALKVNSALTSLHLERNSIGAKGAGALAEALKTNSALTRLDLGYNSIGAKGARALAEASYQGTTWPRYGCIDGDKQWFCHPVDYTNMPHLIMQSEKVVSINNTTQVDLFGQAASESDGMRHIWGAGGQLQFVRGAFASHGGKSFICLSSTFAKGGVTKSRIVFNPTHGNTVTTPRSDIMYVVTEYGCVNLKGQSLADRARLLISIAHPDFREELERQAREASLIP